MPVVDLRAQRDGLAALRECDVCIVGTGPAGATLARELSGTRLRVTVLESGGTERIPEVDALDEIENVGRPRNPDQWSVRNRILGGSSYTWGGRCAPFDEIDFEQRSWVPASGWPLGPVELAPYLERSATHLGLAAGDGFSDDRFWTLAGRAAPAAAPTPSLLRSFFWQHSRADDESYPYEYVRFGRNLAGRLGPDVTLVTGATVVRVDPVESGRAVRSVEVAVPDGSRHTVQAPVVVLATGGVENARLLLVSDTVVPHGLGNDRDLVGRYLMDHLRGPVGTFPVTGTAAMQKRFGRYNVRGHMFRAGLRLSPEVQRAEELLNCAAWLGEVWADDDPWSALRRVVGGRPSIADVRAVAANADLVARGARDYFLERNGVPRKLDALELLCMVEQRPDRESRVTLSQRRDRFGVPLPRIDWRSHPDEGRTMRRMAELVAAELPRMGLPAPGLADWVRDGSEIPASFVDVAHPTGTTRMSEDAANGVVDVNGQVHGVEGLYVTGSSVFPTAGHCNPTQLVVALAVRLADHIRDSSGSAAPTVSVRRPRRVLVTGATGRIGRVVVGDLLDRGYRVRATTSRPVPGDGPGAVEWQRFDFLDAESPDYDALVDGCDAVLHLAAEIGKQQRMPRVNVDATRQLAEAVERAGVGAFCYTSTVSVYGSSTRRTVAEDAPVLTVDRDVPSEYWALGYVRAYGRTKLAGEHALQATAKAARYVILRPTVVVDTADLVGIGEWSWMKRVLAAHRHAHHVFVRDVSDAIIWSMERAYAGTGAPGTVETFNLAEDDFTEPTHAAFLRKAHAVSGDPRFRVPPVPGVLDWLHDLLRFRANPLRRPLWRMRFPNGRLKAAGYRFRYGMAHAHALAVAELRTTSAPVPVTSADSVVAQVTPAPGNVPSEPVVRAGQDA